MIQTNIYKDWIKNQVMTPFGSSKIDNEEDTVMCSHGNVYCLQFDQYTLFVA